MSVSNDSMYNAAEYNVALYPEEHNALEGIAWNRDKRNLIACGPSDVPAKPEGILSVKEGQSIFALFTHRTTDSDTLAEKDKEEGDDDDDDDQEEYGVASRSEPFKAADSQQRLRNQTGVREDDVLVVENELPGVDENLIKTVKGFADAFNGKVVLSAYEFSTMLDIIQQHVYVTSSSAIELLDYLCSNGWIPNDKRLQVISGLVSSKISLAHMMKMTKHFVTIPE
ncbi:hypothetical protein TTRE_0000845401 [Trichuris trichiura]|uniref:Uncharacterized protein n=1 Tax=Trichuris trichiura TaxID=36087 RepID=A0A077ZI86_TRITR|nr:hypothetical protein TTRE_0000845401 [Trichuris trichiura]